MPLYVIALTGTAVTRWTFEGRHFRSATLPGGLVAVCQTRREAPPTSDEELRIQHAAVVELANRVDAVLPARFGSLVDRGTLERLAREHGDEILDALDMVRGRVQMTWRIIGRPHRTSSTRPPSASGRDYLAERRKATEVRMPPAAASILERVSPMVAGERRERGVGQLLATVYHLVNAADVARYRKASAGHAAAGMTLTGPWPPFAFTPRIF